MGNQSTHLSTLSQTCLGRCLVYLSVGSILKQVIILFRVNVINETIKETNNLTEHIVSNQLGPMLGPLICGSHIATGNKIK